MTQEEAIALIKTPQVSLGSPSSWADLGCGNGTFTMALASLLARESKIYAVDQNAASLKAMPHLSDIAVEKIQADFTLDNWQSDPLDGVLMANSLHFVKDKKSLLQKLSSRLKPSGIFLMVEYDMNKSGPWVPYPLPFESMKNIFQKYWEDLWRNWVKCLRDTTGLRSMQQWRVNQDLYDFNDLDEASGI